MDKIALLIPCYNEAATIAKVITDAKAHIPDAVIYVYDNNSSDDTARIAKEHGAIVRLERMQGKGNVIRRMFREIDASCYILIDGDDTYPLDAACTLIKEVLENGADMAIGDRLSSTYFTQNKRPFHNSGNAILRASINTLFNSDIKDILTGYRAFSYCFVKTFPIISTGFEIETEMSIHAVHHNMQVANVVVEYRDRPSGSVSKLNTFRDGRRVINALISLFRVYKPFAFFFLVACVFGAVAVYFFIPIYLAYRETGLVERFPTLFMCGFSGLAAIQSFFAGMILNNQKETDRRRFEWRFNEVYQEYLNKCH